MAKVFPIFVAVLLVLAGYFYFFGIEDVLLEEVVKEEEVVDGKQSEEVSDNDFKTEVDEIKFTGTVLAGNSSTLLDFNQVDYDTALKTDKLVVLYFYATWCPICKKEVASAFYPAFNELDHDKVIGFRVNYNDSDTDANEVALAREFGVAYQHTKVFVKNGNRILKSPESWSKEKYFEEIKKAI
jgi:thiol-disulfide isomerase/thioredoxin